MAISDGDLPKNNTIIVVRYVFHEGSKYYRQVYLDKCLYKL